MTGGSAPGRDRVDLAAAWGAGLATAAGCLGDVVVTTTGYAARVQAALAGGQRRGGDEVAAELWAAYAAYLRQLAQLPGLAVLRLCHELADASARRPR